MRRPTPRAGKPELTRATDETEQAEVAPDLAVEVAPDELDLAKLAAALRRVIPRVDESSRSAWVALTNAMKQPQVDSVRLRKRLARLRAELDGLARRFSRDGEQDDTPR